VAPRTWSGWLPAHPRPSNSLPQQIWTTKKSTPWKSVPKTRPTPGTLDPPLRPLLIWTQIVWPPPWLPCLTPHSLPVSVWAKYSQTRTGTTVFLGQLLRRTAAQLPLFKQCQPFLLVLRSEPRIKLETPSVPDQLKTTSASNWALRTTIPKTLALTWSASKCVSFSFRPFARSLTHPSQSLSVSLWHHSRFITNQATIPTIPWTMIVGTTSGTTFFRRVLTTINLCWSLLLQHVIFRQLLAGQLHRDQSYLVLTRRHF
jgi:hypothetical protein